jgi:hypothetical protein
MQQHQKNVLVNLPPSHMIEVETCPLSALSKSCSCGRPPSPDLLGARRLNFETN